LKILSYIFRFLLGAVFVFSGLIKLIDPVGTQIKLEEYFYVFSKLSNFYVGDFLGNLWLFLVPFSLAISLILCGLEVILGVGILLWLRPKLVMWLSVLLLVFFGILTGYSAQCNPNNPMGVSCVTDCGCFGDFIKFKPLTSFYKDLVLLILSIPLLIFARKSPKISWSKKDFILPITAVLCLSFGVFNVVNSPIIDFRPYKIGNDLIKLRNDFTPAKINYLVSINGIEQEVEKLPEGVKYTFVKTIEVSPEIPPKIHDFYLYDDEGAD
jgi:hypothetical protein